MNSGTKVAIYEDRKTGKMVATIKPAGSKKRIVEIDGLTLKTAKTMDSSSFAKSSNTSSAKDSISDKLKKDSTVVIDETKSKDVSIVRKFGLFQWVGIIVTVLVLLGIVAFVLRKEVPFLDTILKFLGL